MGPVGVAAAPASAPLPLGSIPLVAPASGPVSGSSGTGSGFAAGCAHDASSAGEIIAALITTERTTSLIGDRPW